MEVETNDDNELSGSSSMGTTRSKKSTSTIWQYFTKLIEDGKQKAVCKQCKQKYIVNGTSNLMRHVKHYCKSRGLVAGNAEYNQELFREKLGKAIIRHNLPFNFVEYEGIREIFTYLNQQVQHICRNTAKADILKIYNIEKEKLKTELESLSGRLCLTSDLWSSIASNGYMTVTSHYVDNNWVLQSRVLIFRHIPPPHDGNTIGENLINFLQEWGVEKKIFTVTLDNAAYNNNVVDILKNHQRFTNSMLCNGEYVHVRCGAHILNLIVQSGLKTIDESVDKIRESVKYVRGSESRTMKFVDCVKQLGLLTRQKVIQDLSIRWNSTYLMIESALLYKRAFLNLNLVDSNYKCCPSNEEWVRVEKIASFLLPFYEMTELFSGTHYPTANLYFPNVWKIQVMLLEEMTSTDPVIKNMAISMRPKFDKYWEEYSTVLTFAIVLDPRYKLKFVKFCYDRLDDISFTSGIVTSLTNTCAYKLEELKNNMQSMFEEYLYASPMTTRGTSFASRGDTVMRMRYDMVDDFDAIQREDGVTNIQSQLETYLTEPLMDRKEFPMLDVLQFWKANLSRFPALALMARDILSIPITTVASESTFSHGGRILGKFRSSLLPSNAEALVCGRDWLEASSYYEDEEVEEELSIDIEKLVAQAGNAFADS